jgi:hypothetical protein
VGIVGDDDRVLWRFMEFGGESHAGKPGNQPFGAVTHIGRVAGVRRNARKAQKRKKSFKVGSHEQMLAAATRWRQGESSGIRLFNPLAFPRALGDVPRDVPAESRKPLWLYPNLLSLDAPLVAVAWLHVFAKTWRLGYHPWEAYVSLGLAVWVIYVADRLLDVSMAGGDAAILEARHAFHRKHRGAFRIGVMTALACAVALVVIRMPMAIYIHLLLGGVLVAGFFGLSMLSSQEASEVPILKNSMAGLTFAFGTAMTAHVYRYEFGLDELLTSREFVCFAVLCVLNISAIDLWEHAARASDVEVKASDELSLTLPLTLLGVASLGFALQDVSSRPFFYAILTGAALLYILNRRRAVFSMDALRVLADVALLIPVLVFLAASAE